MSRHSCRWWVAVLGFVVAAAQAVSWAAEPSTTPQPTNREEAVSTALASRAEFDFFQVPLSELVDQLSARFEIPIRIDTKALDNAGVASDSPITGRFKGIRLTSALNLLLRDLELSWVVRNGVVLITTNAEAETFVEVQVHPVLDLVIPPELQRRRGGQPDYHSLVDLITSTIKPTSWSESSSSMVGKVEAAGALAFSQTGAIHDEVGRLLAALRKSRDVQHPRAADPSALGKPELKPLATTGLKSVTSISLDPSPAVEQLEKALETKTDFSFKERPLDQAIEWLGAKFGINIQLDRKALDDAGVRLDSPVSQDLKGGTIEQLLDFIGRDLELDHLIRDEVLVVTTMASAETLLETRVYPVQDLVQLGQPRVVLECPEGEFSSSFVYPKSTFHSVSPRFDYHSLIDVLSAVADTSWSRAGPGSIESFQGTGCLVVSERWRAHRDIEKLLTELRTARDKQAFVPADSIIATPADERRLVVHVFRLALWAEESATGRVQPAGQGGFFAVNPADDAPATASANKETQPASPTSNAPSRPRFARPSAKELAEVIPKVTAPESWIGTGGKGSIHAVEGALVVRQTMPVIRQIAEFLEQL